MQESLSHSLFSHQDILSVLLRLLPPPDVLHLSFTCKELNKSILEGDQFWLQAVGHYKPDPCLIPPTQPPRDRFYLLKHSLESWKKKRLQDSVLATLPTDYCGLAPVSDDSVLIYQSPHWASKVFQIEPKFLWYKLSEKTYTCHEIEIPEDVREESWVSFTAPLLPYFALTTWTSACIFKFTDFPNSEFLRKITFPQKKYRGELGSEVLGEINKLVKGEKGEGTEELKKEEVEEEGEVDEEEEEEEGMSKTVIKIFGKRFIIGWEWRGGHDCTYHLAYPRNSGQDRKTIPGPHVNQSTPLAWDANHVLCAADGGEDAVYSFFLWDLNTGTHARAEIRFWDSPPFIESEWARIYLWASSALLWVQPGWRGAEAKLHVLRPGEEDAEEEEGEERVRKEYMMRGRRARRGRGGQ